MTSKVPVQVQNERTKLSANYLNGIATSLFVVGAIAPIITVTYTPNTFTKWLGIAIFFCFAASAALHWVARLIVGRLHTND